MSDNDRSLQEQEHSEPNGAGTPTNKSNGKKLFIFAAILAGVLLLTAVLGAVIMVRRLRSYDPPVLPAEDMNPEEFRPAEDPEGQEPPEEPAEEPAPEGESEQPEETEEEPEFLTPYGPVGFYVDDTGRTCFEDDIWTTLPGIDVSSWQEDVDWPSVAADGVDFAIIRIGLRSYTEAGTLAEDSRYRTNLNGAKAAGIEVGAYFFSQAVTVEEAREEAEYALELLDGTRLDLPVFFDWEQTHLEGDRTAGTDAATITAVCNEFCRVIQKNGYQPAIYLNRYLLDNMFLPEEYDGYPVWMAQYREIPYCASDFEWWQYSCTGVVAGISVDVDLDVRFVTKQSLIDAEKAAYDPMQENGKTERENK